MKTNPIKEGDVVVVLGCENCDCCTLGLILKVGLVHRTWIQTADPAFSPACKNRHEIYEGILAVDADHNFKYPVSWLAKYPHFNTWYP